jgi:hypothetical protein
VGAGDGDGVALAVALGLAEGVAVGDRVGVAEGDRVGVAVATGPSSLMPPPRLPPPPCCGGLVRAWVGVGVGVITTLGDGDAALVRFLTVVVGSSHATETTAAITSTAVVIARLFACKVLEAPPIWVIPSGRAR